MLHPSKHRMSCTPCLNENGVGSYPHDNSKFSNGLVLLWMIVEFGIDGSWMEMNLIVIIEYTIRRVFFKIFKKASYLNLLNLLNWRYKRYVVVEMVIMMVVKTFISLFWTPIMSSLSFVILTGKHIEIGQWIKENK